MPQPITAALIGAGQRGHHIYGDVGRRTGAVRFAAVVDPSPERRARFAAAHDIAPSRCFARLDDLRDAALALDAWFVSSPDRAHHEALVAGLDDGVPMFVEKPVVTEVTQLLDIARRARARGALVHVAHVLRYAPLFRTVHDVLASGAIGDIVSVAHTEHVHALHMAHSYVRGNWAIEATSSPMLLAKCCHDLDILVWNLTSSVVRIASFGSLHHFRPDRAPEGATPRCTDPCPVADCLFDARRQYLGPWTGWPVHAISDDLSSTAREHALAAGPYGRCVYTAGNDVVDHQVVDMELADGATVTLRMHGHAPEDGRAMQYDGTIASLRAVASASRQAIEVVEHRGGVARRIAVPADDEVDPHGMGHGGGDERSIVGFADAVRTGAASLTSLADSVESHLLAFAAEEARRRGTVVDVAAFRAANEPVSGVEAPRG